MRVLGIDCGVKATGYAVLSDGKIIKTGVIKPERDKGLSSKLNTIYTNIGKIIKSESPGITVIESLFYGKNIKSLISLAYIRGVVLLASHNTEIYEVTPAEVKKNLAGNGRASKQQVRYMVERLLDVPEGLSEDIIDACACALWGEWRSKSAVSN